MGTFAIISIHISLLYFDMTTWLLKCTVSTRSCGQCLTFKKITWRPFDWKCFRLYKLKSFSVIKGHELSFFFFFLHLMHNWSVLLLGNPVSSHFDVEVRANSISQDVHFCACLWLFQPFFVFDATCCRWHFLTLWARWQLPPLWKHPVWSLTMTKYCCSSGRSFLDFILSKVWTEDFFLLVFFWVLSRIKHQFGTFCRSASCSRTAS